MSYLKRSGNSIYPFDVPNKSKSRIYEIYPSHTWKELGLNRSGDLLNFAGNFHKKTGIEVIIPEGMSKVGTLDAADAVVACVTIGHALLRSDIDDDWSAAPPWVSTEEWDLRLWEGMIVRV